MENKNFEETMCLLVIFLMGFVVACLGVLLMVHVVHDILKLGK